MSFDGGGGAGGPGLRRRVVDVDGFDAAASEEVGFVAYGYEGCFVAGGRFAFGCCIRPISDDFVRGQGRVSCHGWFVSRGAGGKGEEEQGEEVAHGGRYGGDSSDMNLRFQ